MVYNDMIRNVLSRHDLSEKRKLSGFTFNGFLILWCFYSKSNDRIDITRATWPLDQFQIIKDTDVTSTPRARWQILDLARSLLARTAL